MYTIINVLGLTVAITSSLLILLYVHYEFSYDRFHEKAYRIFRIVVDLDWSGDLRGEARVNSKISKFAKALPEVEKLVRLHKFGRTI
jgi:putative ABC transport system permease protein